MERRAARRPGRRRAPSTPERPPGGEPIEIVAWDPDWARRAEAERLRLQAGLGEWVVAIEHVGSTAVPGLASKPVLDIDLAIRDLGRWRELVEALRSLGELKRRLAREVGHDRTAYTDGKDEFVREVLATRQFGDGA